MQRVLVPERHQLQPGLAQPDEVRRDDGEFDVDAFRYGCRLTITAQEILVDNASYPTPKIEENTHRFRPLGLGYANLGALLMSRGLAYDSPEGQAYAGAITSIMTAEAYRQSADHRPRPRRPVHRVTTKNRAPFLRVIDKHRDAAYAHPRRAASRPTCCDTARAALGRDLELGSSTATATRRSPCSRRPAASSATASS